MGRVAPSKESPCRGLAGRAAPYRELAGRVMACKDVVFSELAPNTRMLRIKARVEIWLDKVLPAMPYCSLRTSAPMAGGCGQVFEDSSNLK